MRRTIMALLALISSQQVFSAVDTLDLDVTFEGPGPFYIMSSPRSNVDGAEYHFVLECLHDGRFVRMYREDDADMPWIPGGHSTLLRGYFLPDGGPVRLTVMARDPSDPERILSRFQTYDLEAGTVGASSRNSCGIHARMDEVYLRFEKAKSRVMAALNGARAKLAAGVIPLDEYNDFSSSERLISHVVNPEQELAPEGGAAFLPVGPGPFIDELGAVGVQIIGLPASPEDWCGTNIDFHLPAYPDAKAIALTAMTGTMRWRETWDFSIPPYALDLIGNCRPAVPTH